MRCMLGWIADQSHEAGRALVVCSFWRLFSESMVVLGMAGFSAEVARPLRRRWTFLQDEAMWADRPSVREKLAGFNRLRLS